MVGYKGLVNEKRDSNGKEAGTQCKGHTTKQTPPVQSQHSPCLRIHGRVPVRVVKNNGVCTNEVDAQATRPCGQDESKHLGVAVEAVHHPLPILHLLPHPSPKR